MQPLRLSLRDDATPEQVIQFLRERAQDAENLAGAFAYGPELVERRRDGYLTWVEVTENLITNHTNDVDLIGMLHTPGYWEILQVDTTSARPIALIESETRR